MERFQKQSALAELKAKGVFDILDRGVLSPWVEMRAARDTKRRGGTDPGDLTDADFEIIRNLRDGAAGIRRILSFLEDTYHDCENTARITKEQQDLLREHFGREADAMLRQLSTTSPNQAELLKEFLEWLNLQIVIFRFKASILENKEQSPVEELIPSGENAELLLRYFAFYSREADRSVAELERLKGRRSTKHVLPPIPMEAS